MRLGGVILIEGVVIWVGLILIEFNVFVWKELREENNGNKFIVLVKKVDW